MAIDALALACLVQSRNLAAVALLIEHLQREQYTSEELDAEEQTSEDLGSQDCTSRELATPTKSRLDPVSNTLEQLRSLQAQQTARMAQVDQWLNATSDTPQTPEPARSTFKGALQKYEFESPTAVASAVQTTQASANSIKHPSSSRLSKRKATEDTAQPSTRRVTRSSSSRSPLPASPTLATVKQETTEITSPSPSPSSQKRKRPSSSYAPPSKYAHLGNKLVDSLAPNLICVFIGVNPGLRTATAGHAYAHPSNLFWKLLHSSGCTPRRCAPEEDRDLPRLYALGHTNIVTRATKDASELSKAEMDAGVELLEQKVALHRPESACIVGKSIWESIWRVRHGRNIKKDEFKYGWQDERMGVVGGGENAWEGARIFVATSTSGLAATMRPAEKEAVWRELGEFVERRRAERAAEAAVERLKGTGEG
jgi:mismatch-specific thymine-DNA glycosylase